MPESTSVKSVAKRFWPVGLCWLLMMIANAIGGAVLDRNWRVISSDVTMSIVISFFLAQFALATIIGGLVGRTWLFGWLISVLLTTVSSIIVMMMFRSRSGYEMIAFCSFCPLLMMGACMPLIAMRGIRGWSLTTSDNVAIPRASSNLEDLFQLSLIVASCISIGRLFEELPRNGGIQQQLFFLSLFSGFSLFLILPATLITFRTRTWMQRWVGWLSLALVTFVACAVLDFVFTFSMNTQFWNDLPLVLIGVLTSTVTIAVGLWALLASGFKLTYFEKTPAVTSQPLDSELDDELAKPNGLRRQTRLLSALVIGCAVLATISLSFRNYDRTVFLKSVQAAGKSNKAISKLRIRGNEVVGATFLPTLIDSEFELYSQNENSLERLSLSGTQITDATIESLGKFPRLSHLDLSNTEITAAGLLRLKKKLRQLSSLSVASTKVDLATAIDVATTLGVEELDVSGLGITDDQLRSDMQLGSIVAIKLSGNPISDLAVGKLLQSSQTLRKLDVSDTNIDGSGFTFGKAPSRVVLDGTKVTDDNLMALIQHPSLRGISIRRTNITSAVLPLIAKRHIGLMLGEGLISEQDLMNLGPANFAFLCLNHKKFKGACCMQGHITTQILDLSYSSVGDLEPVVLARNFTLLNLSNTGVSDAQLPYVNCEEVDLRNTRVTASHLKHTYFRRAIVSSDQFTPFQLASLPEPRIAIDEENLFPKW